MEQLEVQLFMSDKEPWPNSVVLRGEESCLVIDAQGLKSEARELVDFVQKTGLPVSDVLLTHSHPDHVWGVGEIVEAYPDVTVHARKMVKRDIELDFQARLLRWMELYTMRGMGDEVPTELPPIEVLEGDSFDFEGHEIRFVDLVGAETQVATAFYLPESKTYIAGDHLYNDCHYFVAPGLNRPDLWAQSLGDLKTEYDIERVVPGHGSLGGVEIIDFGIEYLDYYDSIYHPEMFQLELAETIEEEYPNLTLEGVLYWSVGPGPTSPQVIEKKGMRIPTGSRPPE